jgi:hypothetical protein
MWIWGRKKRPTIEEFPSGLTKTAAITSCFALLVVLAVSARGLYPSGLGSPVQVTVTVAGQDGPLQIVGLRTPDWHRSVSISMHVVNTSNKDTEDYSIEAQVVARDRQAQVWRTNDHAAVEWTGNPADRPRGGAILAHGETWTQIMGPLSASVFMLAARDLRSTCLEVTPVVLEVHFADGSQWRLDESHQWGRSPGNPPACPGSSVAEKDWERMNATEFFDRQMDPEHSLFRSVDLNGVQSFSFSCYVRRKDDGHVALFFPR